jgi:hypothetical protein
MQTNYSKAMELVLDFGYREVNFKLIHYIWILLIKFVIKKLLSSIKEERSAWFLLDLGMGLHFILSYQ